MRTNLWEYMKSNLTAVILFFLNIVIGIVGTKVLSYKDIDNGILCILIVVFLVNILICCLDVEKRFIVLMFHCTIFLFLIGRILIPAIQGKQWWNYYSTEANWFAACSIILALLSIMGGTLLQEVVASSRRKRIAVKAKLIQRDCLMQILRLVLAACMICYLAGEIDKVLFMRGKAYEEYFTSYQSRMPFFITFPAGCLKYFLCAFLALKPSKRESFIWLAIYVVSALPMLKIGVRNPIILNCIFAFCYYVLRDIIRTKDEKKWIGKFEKGLIICAIPMMILFLGAYNYIRADQEVELSPVNLVVDFCYKQGTTYDTVLQGYLYKDELLNNKDINYTFGAMQEEILYNSLGKKIFQAKDIGNGNCLKRVYNGFSFAHDLSYVVMKEEYLSGHGRGSSFIIENYVDWGYEGIIFFGLFLGSVCSAIPQMFGKRWITTTIFLVMLQNIFFVPRAESTGFLCFLVSYKFWLCMIGCIFLMYCWMFIKEKMRIRI